MQNPQNMKTNFEINIVKRNLPQPGFEPLTPWTAGKSANHYSIEPLESKLRKVFKNRDPKEADSTIYENFPSLICLKGVGKNMDRDC